MKIPFVKMHGNGNDFVIIDNIKQNFRKDITLIKKIANRRIGIGCDQLILIEKSNEYDAFMRIYNNDGSEAEMCGNAARCVASLLMAGTKKTEICIETTSTLLNASLEKNNEHHLLKVLRFPVNKTITLFNGDGFDYQAIVISTKKTYKSRNRNVGDNRLPPTRNKI